MRRSRLMPWTMAALLVLAPALPALAQFGSREMIDARELIAAPPATQPLLVTTYDPDPAHLWNRLHRALFVRTGSRGRQYDHALDPLLWEQSTYLLRGAGHKQAIAVLDEFLATGGERLVATPLARVLLQRDLWAVFDALAWTPDDWIHYKRDEPAAAAIRKRAAAIMRALALDPAADLPDNYANAVKSKAFAAAYDPRDRARPFLSPDLLSPDGPWVALGTGLAPVHAKEISYRSSFAVLIRLPAGREATVEYVNRLKSAPVPPEFPAGTQLALVRTALRIGADGSPRAAPLVEQVQIRIRTDAPAPDAGEIGPFQDVYEFTLDRPSLLRDGTGLRAVPPDETMQFGFFRAGSDPFDAHPPAAAADTVRSSTMRTCAACHGAPGVASMQSLNARAAAAHPDTPPAAIGPATIQDAVAATLAAKRQQTDWEWLAAAWQGK